MAIIGLVSFDIDTADFGYSVASERALVGGTTPAPCLFR
jgi:hypothetical protein